MAKKKELASFEKFFGSTDVPKPKAQKTTVSDGCKEGEKRFTTILPESTIAGIKELAQMLGMPVKVVAQAAFEKFIKEKQELAEQKKKELEKQKAEMEKLRKELLE